MLWHVFVSKCASFGEKQFSTVLFFDRFSYIFSRSPIYIIEKKALTQYNKIKVDTVTVINFL